MLRPHPQDRGTHWGGTLEADREGEGCLIQRSTHLLRESQRPSLVERETEIGPRTWEGNGVREAGVSKSDTNREGEGGEGRQGCLFEKVKRHFLLQRGKGQKQSGRGRCLEKMTNSSQEGVRPGTALPSTPTTSLATTACFGQQDISTQDTRRDPNITHCSLLTCL